jgi:hypothetical protein
LLDKIRGLYFKQPRIGECFAICHAKEIYEMFGLKPDQASELPRLIRIEYSTFEKRCSVYGVEQPGEADRLGVAPVPE